MDAEQALANRRYAAACLIQRSWRKFKVGQPMPKAVKDKTKGKKGKKDKSSKGEGSPKKASAGSATKLANKSGGSAKTTAGSGAKKAASSVKAKVSPTKLKGKTGK